MKETDIATILLSIHKSLGLLIGELEIKQPEQARLRAVSIQTAIDKILGRPIIRMKPKYHGPHGAIV